MKNRFKTTNEKAMLCRFHTQTGGSTLTAQQVDNNVSRTTIQALSAVLGGTQSLHTNAFDEALALPTDHSAKLALRTQQIIAHESGVTQFVDPMGGSEVIEQLTSDLENEAMSIIEEIDAMGGTISAIETGWVQNEIAKSAYAHQKSIDSEKRKIVGVNAYVEDDEPEPILQKIDPVSVRKQIEGVKAVKNDRDNDTVNTKLSQLETHAKSQKNLMPAIIDCVRAECTLGEIADVLRKQFGEFVQT